MNQNHPPPFTCFKYQAVNIPPESKIPHARNIIKPCTANTGRRFCFTFVEPRISSTWTCLLLVAECIFLSLKWSPDHLAPNQTKFQFQTDALDRGSKNSGLQVISAKCEKFYNEAVVKTLHGISSLSKERFRSWNQRIPIPKVGIEE